MIHIIVEKHQFICRQSTYSDGNQEGQWTAEGKHKQQPARRRYHPDVPNSNKDMSNRDRKKMWYANCQRSFKLDKKRLVEKLISPETDSQTIPAADNIREVCGSLFETPSPPDASGYDTGPIGDYPTEESQNSILSRLQ